MFPVPLAPPHLVFPYDMETELLRLQLRLSLRFQGPHASAAKRPSARTNEPKAEAEDY